MVPSFLRGLLALAVGTAMALPVAAAPLEATRITLENAARLLPKGPDAAAGIGDWFLGNGTICAAVSDPDHESFLSTGGGVLIDVTHCGKDDDEFTVLQPLLNFSREQIGAVRDIRAETDSSAARIVTAGQHNGVCFETAYRLDHDRPSELAITTTLERVEEGPRVFIFGDIALHASGQLAPFVLSTRNPEHSRGYEHPAFDVEKPFEMIGAIHPADVQVLVGADANRPGVSYGLRQQGATLEEADGVSVELPSIALNSGDFSLVGIFTRPFWIGDATAPGLLEMGQSLFMDLKPGDRLRYERRLILGDRADVASVTDHIWESEGIVMGRVDDPYARVSIEDAGGHPTTAILPEPNGSFELRLPAGSYRLWARTTDGRSQSVAFDHAGDRTEVAIPSLGPPARIALPRGSPMRLVFEGRDGTPNPEFGDDGRNFSVGGVRQRSSQRASWLSLAGIDSDPDAIAIPAGKYRAFATRGPEFGVTQIDFEAVAGELRPLDIHPPGRLFSLPGWISADLHVHTGFSDDSGLPVEDQLRAFRAQGAEVIVSTEHDRVVDYAPSLRSLGLASEIQSVIGVEMTTTAHGGATPHTAGHANAFPLPLRPLEYRGGAPSTEGQRLRQTLANQKASGFGTLVQLNHPRPFSGQDDELQDGSLFTHLSVSGESYDPTQPLDAERNRALSEPDPRSGLRDLDFDVMELLNSSSMPQYRATRADWFSFLLQGEYRPGTANSDSHVLGQIVGIPRNHVRLPSDVAFDEKKFIGAIRKGHLVGTTGPLLEATLGSSGPGDTFSGRTAVLEVSVQAAHWVPVGEVRVYVNAARVARLPVRAGQVLQVPLEFSKDSFVTVEVEGPAEGVYAKVLPGFTPFAFANPIFVDADGDGRWTAPGLPDSLPDTLSEPLAESAQFGTSGGS
ncbi:MAG: CehA/McbA family metallohydrolase [Myxococcota bacterium]|nr:CehA/McbA family metallohydrolase [Myxococcota bacterium]